VDVEFEEMVELIGEGGDGAGYCFGDAVVEGERARCLVASVEWNVLELAETVGDLFALLLAMLLWFVCHGRLAPRWLTCSPSLSKEYG
jgi:hypothetical protein